MITINNFINGEWRESKSGQWLDLIDPSRGKAYGIAPDSTKEDVEDAVSAASAAFPSWSSMSVEQRSEILYGIGRRIEEKLEYLAQAESRDNGKPIWLARNVDIPRASSNFKFYAKAISQYDSKAHDMPGAINYTLRQPLGVVACISPWNLPLYLFSWKVAPALAAGNTVVAKPSEVTPLTAHLLSQICQESGLPPGVLNIVHGYGHKVGDAINRHAQIKAISFTGSTKVGAEIASIAAPKFKKLSLEMGGKNPNIIFADCDYDKMLKTTLRSSFANQGQICLCGSRIFVQASIYDKFKNDLVDKARRMEPAPPHLEDTRIGAVVSKTHYDKILSYINLAKEEGGRILCGGHSVHPPSFESGYYIAPTVVEGLDFDCRTNREEVFGPFVTITPFETEEEVLCMANATDYGLSATLWTENLSRAHRMAKEIEAGIVWVNTWLLRDLRTPFGGVKNSGIGREGGFDALDFFTEPKNVCIAF